MENGQLYWVISGITHTDRFPYSEYTRLHGRRVHVDLDLASVRIGYES